MSGKFALIIGNTEYTDPGLAQLTAPGKDAEDFARVLKDQDIGAFDTVNVLVDEQASSVIEAIDEFFDQKKPDDLLVLYFSGHGIRDEIGSLYLAFKNTIRTRLRSTAIKSDYIRDAMDQSRSKRQVLILDCCNSGAFPQGTKAELGGSMGMTKAFQGYGRFVLTASDATQFAWEGDKVIGETDNSLFTHFLVKGLEGEADSDGDGRITVDELYDYAFDQISRVTPKQTPTKSSSKVEGEIVLRQSTRIEDIKPISLSDDLITEIDDLRPYVREIAVQKLEKILKGKNLGLARSAREALEKIASNDDSRRVSLAATQVLDSIRQIEKKAEEERKAREEAERLAILKAEEERLAREKAETERKAKEEAEKLARAQAQQETAEREAMRLKAEREAAEKAAKEAAEKVAKEKAEKELAEREAARLAAESETAREKAEHAAALKAEWEAAKLAARKKTEREAAQKAENEAMELAARRKAEREAKEKNAVKENKPSKRSWLTFGAFGGGIITLALCTFTALYLFGVFEVPPVATEGPVATEFPAPTEQPPSTEQPATEAASSGPYECTDELGCVTIAPNEPIHIAWIQVVSGAVAPLGQTNVNGGQIAVNDINGELLGHPIQYDGEDSLCNSEGGQSAGTKISSDSTVVAILGTSCSSEARSAMPLVSQAGMVMVSSSNTNPDLTNPSHSDHWQGYLRTSHNDLLQGRIAAEFVYNELGLQTAATVHDGSPYAESLQEVFADVFEELGGTITSQESLKVGDTNFRSLLTKIGADSPDIIYFPIFEPEGYFLASQKCDVFGLDNTSLMGADGLFTSGFPTTAGSCSIGMYLSSPYVSSSRMSSFLAKYVSAFGESPTSGYAPHAYDAMNMIFAAIEQVAHIEADGTVYIPRQALRDALYNTNNFPGLTGNLACDENGDCATGEALAVYQISQAMVNGTKDLVSSTPIWQR